MISHKELQLLKSGAVEFIPLPDGYQLSMNESNQIFLSRGSKKKYYLTDAFLRCLYSKKNIDQTLILVKTICKLQSIIKRLKKESITRIELEKLLESVRGGFE
jgi:cobalamin biosynthesis Co2+ chelatase CbiK